jgi:hypothetical protein
VVSSFESDDTDVDWGISDPVEGNHFVLLSTGGFSDVSAGDIQGSKIQNMVYLEAGDTVLGSYFFGTADYLNYNDYGHISLIFAGDPNQFSDPNHIPEDIVPIPGTKCDVASVGDYGSTLNISPSTGGWISFSYTLLEPNQVGYYYLCCEVEDIIDKQYTSYYAVDGLRICRGGDPLSDLDRDCDVDLVDFSTLSLAWLADCNDITNPCSLAYDPNIPCETADIDGSRFIPNQNIWVDPNDLAIMTYEWLYDNSE